MKIIGICEFDLNECLQQLPSEEVVITRAGRPLALVVNVEGMDLEQIELGRSKEFWDLIQRRRTEPTISRAELEKRLAQRE